MNENLPQLSAVEVKELEDLQKMLEPDAKVSKEKILKRYELTDDMVEVRLTELREKESKSHNYIFVGRIGQFCPIVPGGEGGVLYRNADNKYYAVAGTKGYRWLESEIVKELNKQDMIDVSYYDALANEAIETINSVGIACGYGDYYKLVDKEPPADWPPETPKF
jgi:hypothetical protein